MPLYEYACARGHVVTQLRSIHDRHNVESCAHTCVPCDLSAGYGGTLPAPSCNCGDGGLVPCGLPLELQISRPGFRRDHTMLEQTLTVSPH